jgi:hypothetical protein
LVVLLIVLSAWPAAITDHTFGQRSNTPALTRIAAVPAPIPVPKLVAVQQLISRLHLHITAQGVNEVKR